MLLIYSVCIKSTNPYTSKSLQSFFNIAGDRGYGDPLGVEFKVEVDFDLCLPFPICPAATIA